MKRILFPINKFLISCILPLEVKINHTPELFPGTIGTNLKLNNAYHNEGFYLSSSGEKRTNIISEINLMSDFVVVKARQWNRSFNAVLQKRTKSVIKKNGLHKLLKRSTVNTFSAQDQSRSILSIPSDILENNFPLEHSVKAKKEILIVEDNLVSQRILQIVLSSLGYEADIASDGLEALKKTRINFYPLILMDVNMPIMDGLEATRNILKEHEKEKPVIIAISAHDEVQVKEQCRGAGMTDFMSKPVKIKIIMQVLEKWNVKKNVEL